MAPTRARQPKLLILLTNAFGLKSKLGELRHLATTTTPDEIIVTETKFSPNKSTDDEASLPGYMVPIRCNRNEHDGGVAIWIRENLAFQHLQQVNCLHDEVIWASDAAWRLPRFRLRPVENP